MTAESGQEPELELSFPPKPEYVRAARHAVAALARLHEAPDNTVEDVRLAVSEACTSAVQANSETRQEVRLTASVLNDSLVVDVLDRGATIDPGFIEHLEELDTDELPFEKQLSLPLLRGLVDHLEGIRRDGGGMVIRMWMSVGDPEGAEG